MGKQKIDSSDTVDTATHLLHRLQSEGWMVEGLEWDVESGKSSKDGPRKVIRAVVVVKLVPIRD